MEHNTPVECVVPISKILTGIRTRRDIIKNISMWLLTYLDELPLSQKVSERIHNCNEDESLGSSVWQDVINDLDRASHKCRRNKTSLLKQNMFYLSGLFDLNDTEQAALEQAFLLSQSVALEDLFTELRRMKIPVSYILALVTGCKRRSIEESLLPEGRLKRGGLIDDGSHPNRFEVSHRLLRCLELRSTSAEALAMALLGRPCRSELRWEEFEHLEPDRSLVLRVLEGSLVHKQKGVNILLYGPPGTGKTAFCHALAARLGRSLYAVGEADEDGDEPSCGERLKALRMSQFLLSKQDKAVLLVDEMDDVFDHASRLAQRNRLSKVHTHLLLESNPTPILWTCNDISLFEESLLRRFTLAVEIPRPGPAVREHILNRLLEKNALSLDASCVRSLAVEFQMAPALLSSAIATTCLAKGNEHDFRHILHSHEKMIDHGQARHVGEVNSHSTFVPELCRADMDLESLATRCAASKSTKFSFCLYGAPGTGKSAYARYLAQCMGLTVIQKRASDLLDSFVGNSEKRIAMAFAQAKQEKALLIFDEADSLLSDRRQALHSWEISQVNEMLTWMESHPYPFVCTTNLMESLDQACLRRFTFKVNFAPLTQESLHLAFRIFFNQTAPSYLDKLGPLTVGDFIVVRNKAEVLELFDDPDALAKMLEQEVCARLGHASRQVGFTSSLAIKM